MASHNFLFLHSLLLFLQSSVQLQCATKMVQAQFGGSFTLPCNYETKSFRFNKKYWCLGESRSTCEILLDTDGFTKRELKGRIQMIDAGKRGLFVVMRDLQLADTGLYWVGIDKIYTDFMRPISVTVSDVPVSQPRVWSLGSLSGTCWSSPLTVRCASDQGTNIHYSWYRAEGARVITQGVTTDLQLHCGIVRDGEQYYCEAKNSVSSERSHSVSVLLLQPGEEDCIYSLTVGNEHQYDCWDRLSTIPAWPQDTTEPRSFDNQSTTGSQNEERVTFVRTSYGIPVWYEVLRWLLLASLLTAVYLVRRCN